MRVGIFFGGPSREREISFAGGRTVYDNLNKTLFEPVPIFIDSLGHLMVLDWKYVYKGTVRDFYPPVEFLPPSKHGFQVYAESLDHVDWDALIAKVGKRVDYAELPKLIDFAFLSLHGTFGEDGQIQAMLELLKIPYSGSGILPSAIGIDKSFQKKIMELAGFAVPKVIVFQKQDWLDKKIGNIYSRIESEIGFPCVVRPANQGSSIGVSILTRDALTIDVERALNQAFFIEELNLEDWHYWSEDKKINYIRRHTDIREGLGFPIRVNAQLWFNHPEQLYEYLEQEKNGILLLESKYTEQKVIVESFIHGREFSCIVIRNADGNLCALPPTEIIKGQEIYDYKSKYLPGLSRKQTPIEIEDKHLQRIRKECVRLFELFEFNTYARIDGFITQDGTIFLNDPNTTSGMLPSSFFFHQAAEIGLNPSQFLSYIIRTSIWERWQKNLEHSDLEIRLKNLDEAIEKLKDESKTKKRVGVIMGGYSFERHISVESGRNIYEKLASSSAYSAIPIFLSGSDEGHELFQIPINLMLKDNADDINEKVLHPQTHPAIEQIREECKDILIKYSNASYRFQAEKISYDELKKRVDAVFIALHGRPGEDGTVQKILDLKKIAYNGSGPASSEITIDKYRTLQMLKAKGFVVAKQWIGLIANYIADKQKFIQKVEAEFAYPFIAKPVDDGCSSAVAKIKNKEQLSIYLETLFRAKVDISKEQREALSLAWNEEFPQKKQVLIEELVSSNGAKQFLEVTGGLLTHRQNGKYTFEIFEPSEALVSGEVLSLEEKFLAGEGQNITPPRFGKNKEEYELIASCVKADLRKAAEILDVKGYARIDAFVRIYPENRVETIIIEVNSLPGMTPATCIFHQAALNGYKPYDFIDRILQFGLNG